MENPLISIIIPAYNAVKYVEETILSCLNQTYQNIEIIIQDDQSTDGTWELVKKLYSTNTKVKLFRNDKNLGIGDNWNAAYNKVIGEYVIIFNADDLISPDLVTSFIQHFNSNPAIDIVTGKFEILDSNTGQTHLYPIHKKSEGGIIKDFFNHFFFKTGFHWNYTLVKKSLLEKVKLSNGNLFLNTQICDYELWYRCVLNNAIVYFDDTRIWGQYRKHESNNSYKKNGELRSFLKDFLHYHRKSFRKSGGFAFPLGLSRNFLTFCNNSKNFELDVFFLYIKRIAQTLI
ncbi:MAG: glycosyltransferase [Sphingobacteriaceae bacterium]|nr:MAG: glycosyltransferase [Sphingobacteriaceae bacterium]